MLSCTIFELGYIRVICLPHLHLAPPLGLTPFKFRRDIGIGQLESLVYRVSFFHDSIRLTTLTQYRRVVHGRMDKGLKQQK